MEVIHLRNLALEVFKTLNDLNSKYMKEVFYDTTNLTHRPLDIKVDKKILLLNMVIKALETQDLTSGILCQSRLKKKLITVSLKIILINGMVQNVNAIYVSIIYSIQKWFYILCFILQICKLSFFYMRINKDGFDYYNLCCSLCIHEVIQG